MGELVLPAGLRSGEDPEADQQIEHRMMLPMSIRCNTRGTYIYEGTFFNSRKEDVIGETYLGIQIFRFYFKCTNCLAEITMKTDPQNSDYVVESGAARNFEPRRAEEEATERGEKEKEEMEREIDREKRRRRMAETRDAMWSLEDRAMDSKQDLPRRATVSVDDLLAALKHSSYAKGKSTSGLPSVVGKLTDTLTKASIFNSSENGETLGGSFAFKPKFSLKPLSATGRPPDKVLATEIYSEETGKE